MRPGQSLVVPAAFILLGYVILLTIVPVLIVPEAEAPNAAAMLGYNIRAAFWTAMCWTLISAVLVLALHKVGFFKAPTTPASESKVHAGGRTRWMEAGIVFTLVVLAHWPPFLARNGPHVEDGYFLSVLARMQCGQRPFTDFEFIYGPLMIAPAHAWMRAFGYSMASYFSFYALLQGALLAALLLVLQRFIAEPRQRLVTFVVLAVLMMDALLGLNWIGWRRVLSLFAMLLVAARPQDIRAAAMAGIILAVHLAYSLEYAFAGLAACGAIYAVSLVSTSPRRKTVFCGLTTLSAALIGAGALIALGTSGDIATYISATLSVLRQASTSGLGAFKFYWTAHSLALFGLLSLGIAAVVIGASKLKASASEGDRLLIGAVVFALVALKIAFQRADVWHMGAPFFPLAFVVFARPRMTLFTFDALAQRIGVTLVWVAAVANLIGIQPLGTAYAKGFRRAAMDVMHGVPQTGSIAARTYSVQSERSHANPDLVALAAFLTRPELRERPVLLYGRMWLLNSQIGICPAGYLNYEWMYGDQQHPVARLVARNPDILVVLTHESYASILAGRVPDPVPAELGWGRRLASWTSTVHYNQSPIEGVIKERLWLAKLGSSLAETHTEIARFGRYVVLARKGSVPEGTKP